MIDPDKATHESEHGPVADAGALPNPPPASDRPHVKEGSSIAMRLAVICLAIVVSVLAAFRYPQSLNWEKWGSHIDSDASNTINAKEERQSIAPSTNHKIAASGHKAAMETARARRDTNESLHLSANDLTFGFDKVRWGMSINDAKALWPLEEAAAPDVIDLNAPHVYPIHEEDMLSLEHYAHAGCIFSVKFKFEDKKLFSVQMEADGSANFESCHAYVLAALARQYGEGQGGASALSPYRGYSLHGHWRGPSTTVDYNEIRNAVMEIIFSPSS